MGSTPCATWGNAVAKRERHRGDRVPQSPVSARVRMSRIANERGELGHRRRLVAGRMREIEPADRAAAAQIEALRIDPRRPPEIAAAEQAPGGSREGGALALAEGAQEA